MLWRDKQLRRRNLARLDTNGTCCPRLLLHRGPACKAWVRDAEQYRKSLPEASLRPAG